MDKAKNPRIMGTFVPQVWQGDYAMDIDGREEFDATDDILALSAEKIRSLQDNQYESEGLIPKKILDSHGNHPFCVEIEESVRMFFEVFDYDVEKLTEGQLEDVRRKVGWKIRLRKVAAKKKGPRRLPLGLGGPRRVQ